MSRNGFYILNRVYVIFLMEYSYLMLIYMQIYVIHLGQERRSINIIQNIVKIIQASLFSQIQSEILPGSISQNL